MFNKSILICALSALSAVAMADTPVLDQQQANQHARIAQGVKSGELTPAEAHRVRHMERNLRRHEAAAEADGVVTGAERRSLQRQSQHASRAIAVQKHDRQDRK